MTWQQFIAIIGVIAVGLALTVGAIVLLEKWRGRLGRGMIQPAHAFPVPLRFEVRSRKTMGCYRRRCGTPR